MVKALLLNVLLVVALGGLLAVIGCDSVTSGPPSQPTLISPTVATRLIEGTIDGLAPNMIFVAANSIQLDSQTSIRSGLMGLSFADLRLGARARVTVLSDGTLLRATLVEVLDTVGTPTHLQGVIATMSGDENAFQFAIGSQLVRGDGGTQVFEGTHPSSVASLRNGMTVDVDGLQRAEYAYATNVKASGSGSGDSTSAPNPSPSPSPTPPPNSPPGPGELTVGGTVGNLSGVCPVLLFTLDGSAVVTNNSTQWSGGTCVTLAPGASVEATGTQSGNTIVARQVRFN
jgi:hypothetical protein